MNLIYHHTLPAFERYFQPTSLREVTSLLADYGAEAEILAGGTDLLVLMRSRAVVPRYIIDITRVPGLDQIGHDESGGLTIGARVKLRSAELSRRVRKVCPPLVEALGQMATPSVRNMGTVVGNICRASPAGDTIPPLLCLKASVKVMGSGKSRVVALEEFFTGPGETVLNHDEMVTEIHLPTLPTGTGTAFLRASRSRVDLAKVSVASALTVTGERCKDVRIAMGGVAPTPIRAKRAEAILEGNPLDEGSIEKAARAAAEETTPITDVRSNESYRREMSRVLAGRTLRLCSKRAIEVLK
jgi:carbon-monoxide dehydrogenase medium subunit